MSNQTVKHCERCKQEVSGDSDLCASCSAALNEAGLNDLAGANLLRLRHQFEEAEQRCLDTLKRLPQNVEAHVLMGDIHADQGRPESSAQWYELALELEPDSFTAKQKLQVVRDQVKAVEQQRTVAELGLPQNSGSMVFLLAFGAVVLILLCGVIAYSLGQKSATPLSSNGVVRDAISASEQVEVAPSPEPTRNEPPVPEGAAEDAELLGKLTGGSLGARIIQAFQDPRDKQITVTFRLDEGDDPRKVAPLLGREILAAATDAPAVTLRAISARRAIHIVDVTRARVDESQTEAWLQVNPGEGAWMTHVLSNEWPAPPTSNSDTP